jgi:hypothetical protein
MHWGGYALWELGLKKIKAVNRRALMLLLFCLCLPAFFLTGSDPFMVAIYYFFIFVDNSIWEYRPK